MEPITTSAMIGGIVAYLGEKLSKDKAIGSFLSDYTEATVNWIRPIFLKDDGSEKEIIQELRAKPESPARKKAVESAIEVGLEDNSEAERYIKEMFKKISETREGKEVINTISDSKNINTGSISAGGNVTLGDNNKIH